MKKIIALSLIAFSAFNLYSQSLTAKSVIDNAVAKKSPQKAIDYINSQTSNISDSAQKRVVLAFLAAIQETLAKYDDAEKTYVQAAALAGGDVEGFTKKSSERLVLDATRCALSAGNWENANNYLNSAVRNTKNTEVQATIKLYEQWALLCKAQNIADTIEPIAMLKAYLEIPSMESVKPNILLTLWYLTGEQKYSVQLNSNYPKSAETGIVNGKVQIYPAPFWYFTPHAEKKESTESAKITTEELQIEKVQTANKEEITNSTTSEKENYEKPKKQQLGLFRDSSNAQNFVNKLKEKGFSAYIVEETKQSGTKYYSVVVNENADNTMGDILRSAGFECYPVF